MTPNTEASNPFLWYREPRPSVFATKEALAEAKAAETSQRNAQAQRAAAPLVPPKQARHKVGRPAAQIDMARLLDLRAQGCSTRECAQQLNCDHSTVANRLRGLEAS